MKKIQLSIPEPCHENWDAMSPTQQGRYCNACAKEVIDFSNMSDSDVLNYFSKKKSDIVCGRAYPDQLDRDIIALPKKKWYRQWNYAAMFLLLLTRPDKAKAQGKIKTKVAGTQQTILKRPKAVGMMLPSSDFVSGTVKNSKGRPIAFASIKVLHSITGTKTDEYGNFFLKTDSSENAIEISSIGYNATQITMHNTENKEVVLQEKEEVLKEVVVYPMYLQGRAGGMRVRCTVSRRKILADTIKSWITNFNPSIKIYPNPIPKGNSFTISMKLKQPGSHTIQINDAAGRLVTEKKIMASAKEYHEQFTGSSTWSGGVYYVKVADDKGKLLGTGSMVIL